MNTWTTSKKLLLLFFLCAITSVQGQSQLGNYLFKQSEKKDSQKIINPIILPVVSENRTWRYITLSGKKFTKESFEYGSVPHRNGEVIVKKAGKFGVNKYTLGKGYGFSSFIPAQYDSIYYLNGHYVCSSNDKLQLINKDGLSSNPKLQLSKIESLASSFVVQNKRGLQGLLDSNYNVLVNCKYSFIRKINKDFILLGSPNETLTAYSLKHHQLLGSHYKMLTLKNDSVLRGKNGSKWTYYRADFSEIQNISGNRVIFNEHGYYRVQVSPNQWYLYNFKNGKNIFGNTYQNYYAQSRNSFAVLSDEKIGLVDSTGKTLIPPIYDEVTSLLGDSIFLVHNDFDYGVVNHHGDTIVNLAYNEIKSIKGFKPKLFFLVSDSLNKGVFDITGKETVPVTVHDIHFQLNPSYFITLTQDTNKIVSYGAVGLDGSLLAECKYKQKAKISYKYVVFRNQEEQVLFCKNEALTRSKIQKFTQYRDLLKCYTGDTLTLFYVDLKKGKLKNKFAYTGFQTLKFKKQPSTLEYEAMELKVRPIKPTTYYFSQIHGKWGIKHNLRKELIGKPKFVDVRKTPNGLVIIHDDSVKTYKIGKATFTAIETLGSLSHYGEFLANSIAFDFIEPSSTAPKVPKSIPLSSAILSNGRYLFTKFEQGTDHGWKFIDPVGKGLVKRGVIEGELGTGTQNCLISLQDFYNHYNDVSNLVPADWHTHKMLSDKNVGITVKKGVWGFKVGMNHNANSFGKMESEYIKVLRGNQISTLEKDGQWRIYSLNHFKSKETVKDASENKYHFVDNLNPVIQQTKPMLEIGYFYGKYNGSYSLLNIKKNEKIFDKYYLKIVSHYQKNVLIWIGKWYELINEKEQRIIKTKFEAVTPFDENGNFAGRVNNKWKLYSHKGNIISDKEYTMCLPTSFGYYKVQIDGDWGIINDSGNYVLEPNYKIAKDFNEHGLAIVKQQKRYFIIDKNGNFLLETKKSLRRIISPNHVSYVSGEKKKLFLIKEKTKSDIPRYDRLISQYKNIITLSRNEKRVCFDLNNQSEYKIDGKIINGFTKNGIAMVLEQGSYRLIRLDRSTIAHVKKLKFRDLGSLIECIVGDNKTTYYTPSGRQVNLPEGWLVKSKFVHNRAVAVNIQSNKKRLINEEGKFISNQQYDRIKLTPYGTAIVSVNKKVGLIDSNGKMIIQPNYQTVNQVSENLLAISPRSFTGFKKYENGPKGPDNKLKIPANYDKMSLIAPGIIKIENFEGKIGYIIYLNNKQRTIWELNQ